MRHLATYVSNEHNIFLPTKLLRIGQIQLRKTYKIPLLQFHSRILKPQFLLLQLSRLKSGGNIALVPSALSPVSCLTTVSISQWTSSMARLVLIQSNKLVNSLERKEKAELQILIWDFEDNFELFSLISQRNHMVWPLIRTVSLTAGHNIHVCFYGEVWKIISKLSILPHLSLSNEKVI